MKIYIAGKFDDKELILQVYNKLEEMGHTISYDWTTHKNIKPYQDNQEIASQYCQNEVNGIQNADCYIYLSADRGHTLFMEFGAALMSAKITGKPDIYAVGDFNDCSPWFFHPLVKRRENLEKIYKEIGEVK